MSTHNFWVGVSIENQQTADERIPLLLQTPAAVRFLSVEPLLGPVKLGLFGTCAKEWGLGYSSVGSHLHWVIVGGESGPGARPCDVAWIRSIVEQCREAGVSCFAKQLGARPYEGHGEMDFCCPQHYEHPGKHPLGRLDDDGVTRPFRDRAGADPAEWPADLRVREMPAAAARREGDGEVRTAYPQRGVNK